MITSEQLSAYRGLLADGATVHEAAIVLATAAEVDKVIELAFNPLERRDSHGRWISSGTALKAATPDLMSRAQSEDEFRRIAYQTAVRVSGEHGAASRLAIADMQTRRDREQDAQIRMLMRQVRLANQHAADLQKKADISKHKTKSWAMIAMFVGGAILAGVELFLGVPALAQVATLIAPGIIETLFERHKKL